MIVVSQKYQVFSLPPPLFIELTRQKSIPGLLGGINLTASTDANPVDTGQESSLCICVYVSYLPSNTEDIITIMYLPGGITKVDQIPETWSKIAS